MEPGLELTLAGSSNTSLATFASWEATVLTHAYEHVDHISVHAYYEQHGSDRASFLGSAAHLDEYIDTIVATADHVRAKGRHSKRMSIAVDEWNVWYQQDLRLPDDWTINPRIAEDTFSVTDGVVLGSLLISLLRHSDRVSMACLSELVNAMAPIRTEPDGSAWRQTTFHPFAATARHARGTVLRVEPCGPLMETAAYGPVPVVDAVTTLDEETGELAVFLVNRQESAGVHLEVDLRAVSGARLVEHWQLADSDPDARNTEEEPDRVVLTEGDGATDSDDRLSVDLPPLSWHMIRLTAPRSRG